MARGRMVNKKISNSKQVNDLPEPAQLLFSWIIPHLDVNGCFYGSAEMVKNLVFPRKNYSKNRIEKWLLLMENAKGANNSPLIFRYFVGGEQYLYMPGFTEHQIGLRRDKERPEYPSFDGKNTEKIQNKDGKSAAEVNRKIREVEVEGKIRGDDPLPPKENRSLSLSLKEDEVLRLLIQEKIPTMPGEVVAVCRKFSPEWVKVAIKQAVLHETRRWDYVVGVLTKCLEEGHPPWESHKTSKNIPRDDNEKYFRGPFGHLVHRG